MMVYMSKEVGSVSILLGPIDTRAHSNIIYYLRHSSTPTIVNVMFSYYFSHS